MLNKQWKEIEVRGHQMLVSDYGDFYDLEKEEVYLPYKSPNGYLHVYGDLAHRLVVEAFIGPIPKGRVVNHINGRKLDNRDCNLEIVTYRQNTRHAIRTGLFEHACAIEVFKDGEYYGQYETLMDFARELRPHNPKQLMMGLSAVYLGKWKPQRGALAGIEISPQETLEVI
ncbi:HNH endonuclease signature motif containing protein [Bacillus cihuensis]|uniref:HNH endonuclease signature motif containing protein n=1 Tax=Bacillus cihuensis TaxID=1208599 RepID=UPI0003FD27CC|nr:HNH endonuclease signature motif containing protein [Bacillus cihuensis]